MISTSNVKVLPANGWLKSMVTCASSKALTTPGNSVLAASLKITSKPSDRSIPSNCERGMICTFCGLGWPKAFSGRICRLRVSPALNQNSAASKPGSRLPSPTLKVAGALSKVLSTVSPFSRRNAKCKVTSVFWPMRCSANTCSVMNGFSGLFTFEHIQCQHYSTNRDCTVGKVESREIPAILPMHQNEIDHMAQGYAVIQIAQRATQHQRQRDGHPGFVTSQTL